MKPDVIVVGTGMGGATIGYSLAKAGMRVLFLEKGLSRMTEKKFPEGQYAEVVGFQRQSDRYSLQNSGRFHTTIKDVSNKKEKIFIPFIGSGTGGSSALYGAVLERFRAEDFSPGQYYTQFPEASVPKQWPVAYGEMEAFYTEAESLFKVRNIQKTITNIASKDIDVSDANKKIFSLLKHNGYHPYLLPTATENIFGCKDNCQSFLCANGCKNDSEKIALRPAIQHYQAELLDQCEAIELTKNNGRISSVVCRKQGQRLEMEADMFILASGALLTPALLLNSNGLINSSGLVGTHLMRHYIDLFAIKLKSENVSSQSQKQIGFNDLYMVEGEKFGTVQSFGLMPPTEVVIEELIGSFPMWSKKLMLQVMRPFYTQYFSNKLVFASIMEDLPFKHNKITYRSGKIQLQYELSAGEKHRVTKFRKHVTQAFNPLHIDIMKQAHNNQRIAHVCGTCRFGDNPKLSVLNRFNQAHDIRNLFVVDASFFPTSGGINPALTIAANALRVADAIVSNTTSL